MRIEQKFEMEVICYGCDIELTAFQYGDKIKVVMCPHCSEKAIDRAVIEDREDKAGLR